MRDYASVSFWLETSGDDLTPRPSLGGSIEADVAILGAGYTGLWTAYYLLRAEPSLRVVILERDIAGFGASGRNGAWCAPGMNISLSKLARLHGREAARQTYQQVSAAIDEIGSVADSEGMDIDWRRGGELIVARGGHESPSIQTAYRELEDFGFGDHYQVLDAEATSARVAIGGATAALYTPDAAAIHPGKLARGLARVVERMGATIYEGTEVTDYQPAGVLSRRPSFTTMAGEVTADVIVLAGEAYLTRLRRLHRQLIPIWSLIVLTEPLPDDVWAEIGWRAHELIGSPRYTVVYLSRTTDGRLLFGGRGAPYRYGSPIREAYDRHDPTHEMLRANARAWFPQLRDARFSHAWGGPLGMARDWHPTISFDKRSRVATARGYVGHGVSNSNLSGHTLAELITGQRTVRTELPLVNHRSRSWEPEPFRWIGVRFVQGALGRVDRLAEESGQPPRGRSLEEWLARH
ncbi:MAG TPA: FAD-dependent oxidoreductase [Candidatus Limnocylindrales bacterium]|nr:FAD-dependent oxidoreductase [Candidatus Limnocylindrales bacterium]